MGGWKLEVAKMALYMTFPVFTFHYFNQPQYYENAITKIKKEHFPVESEEQNELLRKKLNKIRETRELEELKAMVEMQK